MWHKQCRFTPSFLLHHGADTSSIHSHDIKYPQMKKIVRSFGDIQLDLVIRELIVQHQNFMTVNNCAKKETIADKDVSSKIKKPTKRRRGKMGTDVPTVSELKSDDTIQSYEICPQRRDEFVCKLLNKLYDCILGMMKKKQTNPHIKERILKLIRTCVSGIPNRPLNPMT